MNTTTIIEDLYSANEWAWQRLFRLCEGFSDEQLDAPREMGFGSLRATLFHILTAAHAADALRLCEQHPDPIHLLVIDVVMPGLSGRELAERLLS